MSKPQYIDIVDHINKYHYDVIGPAHYTPISNYDKLFNFDPLYQPTDIHMPVKHTLTIDNLIDMYTNHIQFRIMSDRDTFEIYNKLYLYLAQLAQNPHRSTEQEIYFKKASKFLEECAKVCRINHTRLRLDDKHRSGTMSNILAKVNSLWS